MRMQPATSIPVSECLWGDPDDFSKFIDGIVFQWYHLNTILSINWLLSKIIYIILQLHFNCQEPPWGQALVISLSFPVILGHSVLEDFAVMMNWTISFIGEVTRYGLGGSAWSLDCSTSFVS